jgi:hypothetical protein
VGSWVGLFPAYPKDFRASECCPCSLNIANSMGWHGPASGIRSRSGQKRWQMISCSIRRRSQVRVLPRPPYKSIAYKRKSRRGEYPEIESGWAVGWSNDPFSLGLQVCRSEALPLLSITCHHPEIVSGNRASELAVGWADLLLNPQATTLTDSLRACRRSMSRSFQSIAWVDSASAQISWFQ